ncbi:MAG TPA: hypothetical protein VNB94_04980 [Mycobacteriales bacterium]|nr:hypothetical protein [Mycobacteriales bacterium]
MNTPFTRRADAFAEALDRAAAGGAVDAAAAAAGVAPMVFLVERLGAVPLRPVGVSPGVREALLAQAGATVTSAGSVSVPAAAPAGGGAASTATAGLSGTAVQLVAGALSLAVAVTGVGVAANRSLPGDPFYRLKQLVERSHQGPADVVAEAGNLSGEAAARLAELQRLLDSGSLDQVDLREVDRLIAEISAALDAALDRMGAGGVTAALLDELTATWNRLAELVPALPAGAQPDALQTLAEANNRLGVLVDGASPVNGGVPAAPHVAVPTAAPSSTVPPSAAPRPSGAPTGPNPVVTPTTVPTAVDPTGVPATPIPLTTPTPPSGQSIPGPTMVEVPGAVVLLPELPLS